MLKKQTAKEFLSDLSCEDLEILAQELPVRSCFQIKDEYVGKTKELILDMYKDCEVAIFQENEAYTYLDIEIQGSHLVCILFIDICVKACVINASDISNMEILAKEKLLRPQQNHNKLIS